MHGAAFGHRLMMDRAVPGGVAVEPSPEAILELCAMAVDIRHRLQPLVAIYESKPSLQDRMVGTGVTTPDLVHRFGAGGHVGRASAASMRGAARPTRPMTISSSKCRCSPRAT
jgi:Ni,Fe-hydrogenase III large subunit